MSSRQQSIPENLDDLPPDGGERYNRLVFEKSPYLLQHATNPVDWYPWGEEALNRAREADRPIFLSIGYSTCRWCHVMERESFEDEAVAGVLNRHFVPIKVDREERPDLDQIYMTACQAMTGSGGWPLNVVLTPEGEPFFATTYLPPEGRGGRSGLKDVLQQLARLWEQDRERVLDSAQEITELLRQGGGRAEGTSDESLLQHAAEQLEQRYDDQHGGFGHSPKFPSPHNHLFLLRWHHRSGDAQALSMVKNTFDAMRRGGIYDQVGFGFHRYSTDRQWLVPHFEKMLYDQAMHMMAYAEAFQVTGEKLYGRVAREIGEYLRRDMAAPSGGFYAAEDAESEGEEGKFYLWSREEWCEVLGEEEGALFADVFNLTEEGNYRDEATGRRTGRNIPHLGRSFADEARRRDMAPAQLRERWGTAREKLLAARSGRVRPHRDEKIVTAWNGLAIASLAKAAGALSDDRLRKDAVKAADFVLENLRTDEGRLLRYHRTAAADVRGFADDYAFFAWGLLELYETTADLHYLDLARELTHQMLELFQDEGRGCLGMVGRDAAQPVVRPQEVQDGALPSSNSAALLVLRRLGLLTGEEQLRNRAETLERSLAGEVSRHLSGYTQFLSGVDFGLGPNREIVIAGDAEATATGDLLAVLRSAFIPRTVWLLHDPDESGVENLPQYAAKMTPVDGAPAAYVCEDYACHEPLTDPETLREMLEK